MMTAFLDHLLTGEPLAGELVIDVHAHIGPYRAFYLPDPWADGLLRSMDRLGITLTLCAPTLAIGPDPVNGNLQILQAQQAAPTRLRGYVTVSPHQPEHEMLGELERYLFQEQFAGIKLHPSIHGYSLLGPNYAPVYEFARAHGIVILSHGWLGDANCDPNAFLQLAKRYPDITFLLGHSGGTLDGNEQSIAAAKEAENLHLDLTASIRGYGMLERMVDQLGAERLLFGTDSTFLEPSVVFGCVLGGRISDEAKRLIFGGNARRLFGERIAPYLAG
ncbi:MAG TPA: amidohydrolase family protein [Armatimonadota bacterium]|jgi:hypothetical protein